MEKISKALFSMGMMALGLLVFLVAIAWATILESTYDIQTAKILVYNANWFTVLLIYLCINLIVNIFRYQMFQRQKAAMLAFHLSFIVIIIGAGVTRFFGFEGLMLIRENTSSNFIYATDPHLSVKVNDGKMQFKYLDKKFMSEVTNNYFDFDIDFPNHKTPIKVEYVDFKKKQIDTILISKELKTSLLDIVSNGKKSNYLEKNNFVIVGSIPISFEKANSAPGIQVTEKGGKYFMETKFPTKYLPMTEMMRFRQSGLEVPDSMYIIVPTDTVVPFLEKTLYVVNEEQFVFNRVIPNAKLTQMSSGKKDVGVDILTVKITDGKEEKIIQLTGGISSIPERHMFKFGGLTYEMEYGSTTIDLPFSIACRDFQLETYPGSETASSFASEVTVIDTLNNVNMEKRIFMNNVMDYGGYRFFQSAYDLDNPQTPENEEGTRLSVNYDFWGTTITYIGYLLMTIGMMLSLFAPSGRFKELLTRIKKSRERREASLTILVLLTLGLSFSSPLYSQDNHNHESHEGHDHEHDHEHDHDHDHDAKQVQNHPAPVKQNLEYFYISEDHSNEMATMLVQDFDGRIVPLHTVADHLLRKIYGSQTYKGKNAVQTVLSMQMYPEYWITADVIAVPSALRERLGLGKYASFKTLNDPEEGEFRWMKEYQAAHQKLESKRDEFEKKIIKLVEKNQVLNSLLSWQYFRILPVRDDANHTWISPLSQGLHPSDSMIIRKTFLYINAIHNGAKENKWGVATDYLKEIKAFQRKVGKSGVPSIKHVEIEISYNKMNVFRNTMYLYLCTGLVLLILFFVRIFIKPTLASENRFKKISIPFVIILGVTFLYHAYGLGMRWYISGHAPWSNGYEAVVFIAWVTMIAGFLFAGKNPVVLAGTAILAFFMIFVTELNLMDPEITPLQPVLKSYWLMIHVAVITGSYGFLGLGSILGFLNMNLYIFRFKSNGKRLTAHINEITSVSEMTITIGLFMLTIGTFLGGIWANESWGRYWGWDPKETWALVSVLVFAILLHLRYIPGLKGKFLFNTVSFWAYSAILFTFFGVNFYLVGLHSYAQGEGLAEIPNWIFYTVFVFIVFTIIAILRNKAYSKQLKADEDF